jgi:hypothetical protein
MTVTSNLIFDSEFELFEVSILIEYLFGPYFITLNVMQYDTIKDKFVNRSDHSPSVSAPSPCYPMDKL